MTSSPRARYLVAIGLMSPVLAAPACNRTVAVRDTNATTTLDADAPAASDVASAMPIPDDATARPLVADTSTPTSTPTPTRGAQEMVRHDAGGGTWTLEERPVPERLVAEHPRATCPSGMFCVTGPNRRDGGAAAPAPYGECADQEYRVGRGSQVTFLPDLTQREREKSPGACCYSWYEHCPGGRPLRDGGDVLVAEIVTREDWDSRNSRTARSGPVDHTTRDRLTRHWLAEARAEHASIASFSRFSLQLLALGAPRDLVVAAHEAALDEVRHAEQCYELAARISGVRRGPGPMPLPAGEIPTDPAIVAEETLRDGCLGESVAAHLARAGAYAAEDADVAGILQGIADDEETHAELAWRTVAWLLTKHGQPVRRAIERFLAELASAPAPLSPASPDAGDDTYGVLGEGRRRALHQEAVRAIVVPCLQALIDTRDRAREEVAIA